MAVCEGKYVYCIIKSQGGKRGFGNIGFGNEEVYSIDYKDFAPVMSSAPVRNYEVNEEEIGIHRKVVEQVMKEHSVVPVAYGMVFKNKKLVGVAMAAGNKAIKKAMQAIDNKIELGVKVFVPRDIPLDGEIEQIGPCFLGNLKRLAADSKELNLFSERLVLNASFLVGKDKIDEFSGELEILREKYPYLKTQYSGPWPPYNFVDIHILSRQHGGFR